MKVKTDRELAAIASQNLRLSIVPPRSPGNPLDGDPVHVSDLLFCLRQTYYRFQDQETSLDLDLGDVDARSRLRMAIGVLIEQGITLRTATQLAYERDGIIGHVDWIFRQHPTEIKATWNRSSTTLNSMPMWKGQFLSYLKLASDNMGSLVVVHVTGLGGRNRVEEPSISAYTAEATQDEIDEHWEKMIDRREKLLYHLKELSTPTVADGRIYEDACSLCEYLSSCLLEIGALKRAELLKMEEE